MTVIDGHDGQKMTVMTVMIYAPVVFVTFQIFEHLSINMVKQLSQTPSPKRTGSPAKAKCTNYKAKCTNYQLLNAFHECYPKQTYVKKGIVLEILHSRWSV